MVVKLYWPLETQGGGGQDEGNQEEGEQSFLPRQSSLEQLLLLL